MPNIVTIVEYSKKHDVATELRHVVELMKVVDNDLSTYFNSLTRN
ncbi:hypothetical protein [Mycoplasmopsis fermentans]|nr:hypothetical protein [Mycoplasmopsis fermentans]